MEEVGCLLIIIFIFRNAILDQSLKVSRGMVETF